MKHLVRTFVGIRCGRAMRDVLHREGLRLQADDPVVKLPAIEDLHITLQYLGDTAQEDITHIAEALEEAVEDIAPFLVGYVGVGAFPDVQRPRAIWAGIDPDGGAEELRGLARSVSKALRPIGYRGEKRAYHPHVTIARAHSKPSDRFLHDLSAAHSHPHEMDLGEEMVSELKLILSDPGHGPYHYIDLTTVPLGG